MTRPAAALLGLALVTTAPSLLAAQGNAAVGTEARALGSITERDFRARLGALAHDSTRGRETPSPELDKAAGWVGAQFAQAGLRPGGDSSGFLQFFKLRHTRVESIMVTIAGPAFSGQWGLGREFLLATGRPSARLELPIVLLAGVPADTTRPFGDVPVRGAAVLLVLGPDQLRGSILNPLAARAEAAGVAVLGVAADLPEEQWLRLAARQRASERWAAADDEPGVEHRMVALQVRYSAGVELLRAAGEDPASLLTAERQGVRLLRGFTLSTALQEVVVEEPVVANVIGILEGSDPALRHEAVIFTSHLDHVGAVGGRCQPARDLPADSVCNGADDNASGTVGVIELAEAFALLQPRPARTLVFAAFTAEERGLLGSKYYVAHPVVPIEQTAAVINLDMIVRNPRDTVGLVGSHYSSLGGLVDRVAAAHPEFRLTPTDDPTAYQGSDHLPFAQRGVPALFFFSGIHPDLHTAADNPDRADTEQGARILRLVFEVGLEVANTRDRPVWDPAARDRVVVPPTGH